MITFQESTQTFYLSGKDTTYAFRVNKFGKLEHLYFGKKIGQDDLDYLTGQIFCSTHEAQVAGGFPENHMASEFPTYGLGDFREPAFQSTSESGDALNEFLYKGYEIYDKKPIPTLPSTFGGKTLDVCLVDSIKNLELHLLYSLFEDTDAITRSFYILNKSDKSIDINRAYSFSFDLQRDNLDALALYGAWATERTPDRQPLARGVYNVDSKRLCSSAALNPFLAVMDHTATEDAGNVWAVNLIYSSSYELKAEPAQNGTCRVLGGISSFNFNWELEAGARFDSPEAVLVFSDAGLTKMSQTFHDTYRHHLLPKKHVFSPRPVVINNWEATYFNFDNQKLMDIVDAVEGTGIDTFVLDDGWFGVRNNSNSGLGDWYVNTTKLEGGLNTIINYCHKKGLRFGLWFEPEMVNPDSDLYRAHPDWAIHAKGHTPLEARGQYCLDLTRKDVCDYIVESVNKILDTHEIDYVKWDYNRNPTENMSDLLPPHKQKEFAHRYALGLYDICERIVNTHPNIFFEGCSSGGCRFDPAILYYFPQIWTSDDSDAAMRTRIQWGTSYVYPLSTMSCHTSICPNHQTGRTTPFSSRANIAHLGATGYELDASKMPKEELEAIPEQIVEYHKMEKAVLEGDFYRLVTPFDDKYFACEIVSKDKSYAHVTLMKLLKIMGDRPLYLRLKGLDPDAIYELEGTEMKLTGATLMNAGLLPNINRMKDFESQVFIFKKI